MGSACFDLLKAWVRRCRSLFHSPSREGEGGAHPRWGRRPGGERAPVPPPQLPADPSRAVSGAGRPSAGREFWASEWGWGGGMGGWDELLRVVSSRRLGGVERRGCQQSAARCGRASVVAGSD